MPPPQRSYSTAALLLCAASAAADVVLDGGAGLKWLVMSAGPSTYALGQPFLNRQPLDNAPVDDGIAFWRRMSDELVIPVLASSITVDASGAAATLSGSATLPSGGPGGGATDTAVAVRVALDGAFTAATLSVSFSSEAGVAKNEWQLCVKWAHDGESADEWRAQGYPIAANASRVDNARLEYVTLRHLKMRLDSPSLRPPPPTPNPPPPPPTSHPPPPPQPPPATWGGQGFFSFAQTPRSSRGSAFQRSRTSRTRTRGPALRPSPSAQRTATSWRPSSGSARAALTPARSASFRCALSSLARARPSPPCARSCRSSRALTPTPLSPCRPSASQRTCSRAS